MKPKPSFHILNLTLSHAIVDLPNPLKHPRWSDPSSQGDKQSITAMFRRSFPLATSHESEVRNGSNHDFTAIWQRR